jgi:hypothetical protein
MVTMQRLDLQNSSFVQNFFDASPADKGIFIAPFDLVIKRIDYVHSTAGSDGSAVTLQVERLQGTEAPAAGDNLLSAAFNCKGTANTVQNGALTATTADLTLSAGNRLGLNYTGTLTALAGVVVTVVYQKA